MTVHCKGNTWDIHIPNNIIVRHRDQLEELMQLLSRWTIHQDGPRDAPSWTWQSNHTFIVHNAYERLNDGGLRSNIAKVIW